MTPEQQFQFDLQGYLVIPGVLGADECRALSDAADRVWPRQEGDGPFRRTADISRWSAAFRNLMDHPALLPYLVELLGARLRIDHDYCIFMRQGAPAGALHGGPRGVEPDHWYEYRDGKMRNGLMVATWTLTDAAAGDGGFICIPGSHKTNYRRHLPADVAKQQRPADYVIQPPLRAGDVLIFTEALIHGTAPWTAAHERRALLYKYSPCFQSWAKVPYDLDHYPDATLQQQRLMAPPSVEDHPAVVDRAD